MTDSTPDPLRETRAWIDRETRFVGADAVTLSDIRRKLEVFCCDCPLFYDKDIASAHGYRGSVAPVSMTALWSMQPYWTPGEPSPWAPGVEEKTGVGYLDVPCPYTNGFNASSAVEYFEPLYPGDILNGAWSLRGVSPKRTRLGEGVFLSFDTKVWKQSGELVAVFSNTAYKYRPDAPSAEAKGAPPAPPSDQPSLENNATIAWRAGLDFAAAQLGDQIPPYQLWLNYQRLVMSVSADRMFSSIHHNRDAARAAGLADIIFNTVGYQMLTEITLRRWMGLDGRVKKLGPFKMTGNTHPGDTLTCTGSVSEKSVIDGEVLLKLDIVVHNQRVEAGRGEAIISRRMA